MLTRATSRPSAIRSILERLEEREVPAINILVDYSLDLRANGGIGFFEDHPDAKVTLNRVAYEMGQRVSANFAAINPSGSNTWRALFYDPRTGDQFSVSNLHIAANTIILYAGARSMPGAPAAVGGYGGYSYSGSSTWGNTLAQRGWSGFSPWGGSISFDTSINWHFGLTTADLGSDELDFYSVATHEIGHVLGIGTSPQWFSDVQGSNFVGAFAESIYGGPIPLAADHAHWADGVTINGRPVSLDPSIDYGTRVTWTGLDQAVLRDIGWAAGTQVSPPTVSPPPPPASPPPPPPPTRPPVGNAALPVLVSNTGSGVVSVYARGTDGNIAATGQTFTPFAGYTGPIRTAVADFNADGVADYAFATGRGTAAQVRIIDGDTGADILAPTTVLSGFTGGAFLAAGDIDGDGKAELAVSADSGWLPVVRLFSISDGQLVSRAWIMALGVQSSSGVRVAMGDLNGDGKAELVTAAGQGWSPVVRIYGGAALAAGRVAMIGPAFFAFGSGLRTGVNIALGDVDGDGRDDLITSQGAGGTSLVRVWSGAVISANRGIPVSSLATFQQFYANGTVSREGISIVARDLDGNGQAELVTAPSGGSSAWLRVLSVDNKSVTPMAPVFPGSSQGVTAGISTQPWDSAGFENVVLPGGPCLCCSPRANNPMCQRVG